MINYQIANSKSQINSNYQLSNSKLLKIEIWNLFAIWCLIFVICISFGGPLLAQEKSEDKKRQAKIEKALKELKDENVLVRGDAVETLGKLGAKEYVKDIAGFLKDDSSFMQASAISALGKLGAKEYAKDIAKFLKYEDKNDEQDDAILGTVIGVAGVREKALFALGELEAKEYAKDIAGFLKDKDATVRDEAAVALEKLGAKEYVKDIAELLKDKNARDDAVSALGWFGAKEYADEIAKLLNDSTECNTWDEAKKEYRESTLSEVVERVLKGWGYDVEKIKKEQKEKSSPR